MNHINSKTRIIVVEDIPTDLRSLTSLLKAQGYEVQGATEGMSALSKISLHCPDLILLHNTLPDMDSYELCARLKTNQQTGDIPIIFICGLDEVEERGRAFEVGGADYIFTPFQPAEVLARVKTHLTLRGLQQVCQNQGQPWPAESSPELQAQQNEAAVPIEGASLIAQEALPLNGSAPSFNKGVGLPASLRILVAEDNPTNQKLALRMLDRLGYNADVVSDGRGVIETLARQPYDVVFMDLQMPEMDGLEATRQIRQRWPNGSGPRIIALTAEVALQERDACLAAGADDFIGKPMRLEDLVAALQKCQPGTPPPNPLPYVREGESEVAPAREGGSEVALPLNAFPYARKGRAEVTPPANPPSSLKDDESRREGACLGVLEPKALAKLQAMVGGQNSLVLALIESTLQDAPQLLRQMRQALETEDPKALKLAAHTLKSLANNFGAAALATICKELESMGKAGTFEGAEEQIGQAETEYEQVRSALEMVRTTYQS
jgi:CheY-like chemotaxis protein/HPt (histidine-containing phosphotransfer) domain-containing protein